MIDLNKFKKIQFKKRTNCMICGTAALEPIISLPYFPLTEIYVNEKISEKLGFVDQAFHLCSQCSHGQLVNVIDPEVLYGDSYVTRTSTSQSAIEALDVFLSFIDDNLKDRPIKNIVEIGCNDTYLLKRLKNRAKRLYGIDPILRAREDEFMDDQITPIGDLFENVNLKEIGIELDVVLSSHTLEHINDPKGLIKKLIAAATSKTLFFFQFPGLEPLVKNAKFDQVHHQHLNYFSLKSVIYMLEDVGAELIDFRFNLYHWGALMIAFRRKGKNCKRSHEKFDKSITQITDKQIIRQYELFKECMDVTNRRIASYKNETIYGYGAALMLPILNYYLKELTNLKCIIDDDKNKNGLYYMNLPLKIVLPKDINNIKDLVVLITAINSKQTFRAIMSKLIDLKVRDIIIPANLI